MNQQQLRGAKLSYDLGVIQRTLGDFSEICGNEYVLKCDGDAGFMVAISASLVDLSNGRPGLF